MIYGVYQSAAGLRLQEYRQTVATNNLANVDTPGFKADSVAVVERPVASSGAGRGAARERVLDGLSGGLFATPTFTDFSPAELDVTGNPLDVALVKNGFLRVATPDGERYTRDGRLTMRQDGALVMSAGGHELLDRNGKPLRLDPQSRGKVTIDDRGRVRQGDTEVGQIGVVDFADRRDLQKSGRNLLAARDGAAAQPVDVEIRQGAVEQSGANPIRGLTDMIAATRAYEMNATLISLQDSTLGKVVNDVGRPG